MLDILNETIELKVEERVNYWLEVAKEVERREDYECLIEDVNDIYLKGGVEPHKLYGFYEDSDLEMFFISNNIKIVDKLDNGYCILSYNDNLYEIETVDLINRHGDDLVDETVYQLHTLAKK